VAVPIFGTLGANWKSAQFQRALMASFRPQTHRIMAGLLKQHRRALKLSYRKVVDRLPEWMAFKFTTLQKIEKLSRDISYAELREIALVLGTSAEELSRAVETILAAKERASKAVRSGRVRAARSGKKKRPRHRAS